MAYAERFFFQFRSDNGTVYKISILQDGFSGTAIQRPLGGAPTLRRDRNDNILGTSLEFLAECQVDGEFADLYTTDAYEFKVILTTDSRVIFEGFLAPEMYAEPDLAPPYDISLYATDGLGELKSHIFSGSYESIAAVIHRILLHTGLEKNEWITSSLTPTSGLMPGRILESIYIDWSSYAGKTEYDVLQLILSTLNAKILQFGIVWWIVRETDLMHFWNVGSTTGIGANNLIYGGSPAPPSGSSRTPVYSIGSMSDTDWWPVGNLSMAVEAAKKALTVYANNVYLDNFIKDNWSGVTPVEGAYTLTDGDSIQKQLTIPIAEPTTLAFAAHNNSPRTSRINVTIRVKVKRTGVTFNDETRTEYLELTDEEPRWRETEQWNEIVLDRNATEDPLIEVAIPFAAPVVGRRTSGTSMRYLTDLTMTIDAQDNSAVLYDIVFYNNLIYTGTKNEVTLANTARERGVDKELVFTDAAGSAATIASQQYFLANVPKNAAGTTMWGSWRTTDVSSATFLQVIGADYARAVAAPRWRVSGVLNMPAGIAADMPLTGQGSLPLFFEFRDDLYFADTFSWDLLHDEAKVEIISVPVVTVEVDSVITSGLPGESGSGSRTGSKDVMNVTVAKVNKSAYEVWTDAGYVGTQEDFLEWIKGVGFESVSSAQDGTVIITLTSGDQITIDLNHNHPGYAKYVYCATEAAYNAISPKESDTLYLILGS